MADWFVDSAAGANSNSGTAFGSPKKYLWLSDGTAGLFNGGTAPAAGDTVYVLKNHSEDHGNVNLTLSHAGTETSLIRVINVDSFNSGSPNVLGPKNNALIKTGTAGSARDITVTDSIYFYGFKFEAGDEVFVNSGNGTFVFFGCELSQLRTGSRFIHFGGSTNEQGIMLIDCVLTVAGTGGIRSRQYLRMMGGSITAAVANQIFELFENGGIYLIDGVDLSAAPTALVGGISSDSESALIRFTNCKLKAAATIPEHTQDGFNIEVWNCDDTAGNLRVEFRNRAGSVSDEATVVRTGGASYLSTGYSYLYSPNTNVAQNRLLLGPVITGNADFSTAKTIDIFIVNNTRDLKDDEIWFDITFGTSGAGGSTFETLRGANWLVAPATHADDTVSVWGGSNTFQQKMSLTTVGSGRESTYQIKVYLAVDVDVYIDPHPILS